MRKNLKWLSVLALTLASIGAHAADVYSCSVSAAPVVFGNYSKYLDVTGTGSISVSCSLVSGTGASGQPYTINIDAGGSSSYQPRLMSSPGGGTLAYNLYTSGSYATVWGDGLSGTGNVSGNLLGNSPEALHTVYGRLPANQNPAQGNYSDTLLVTVNFN